MQFHKYINLVLTLYSKILVSCSLEATITPAEIPITIDSKLNPMEILQRLDQSYYAMTVDSNGVVYLSGISGDWMMGQSLTIRALHANGKPKNEFGSNSALNVSEYLSLDYGSNVISSFLIPIDKNGHEEILGIFMFSDPISGTQILRYMHFNTIGGVTYISPKLHLPGDRRAWDSGEIQFIKHANHIYMGYQSNFTTGTSAAYDKVAFLKTDLFGNVDSGFGDNGILSVNGTVYLGKFIINSNGEFVIVSGGSGGRYCYVIDGTNYTSYNFDSNYNGVVKTILKDNKIVSIFGDHKIYVLSEDCNLLAGPIDIGLTGNKIIGLADAGLNVVAGISLNVLNGEISQIILNTVDYQLSKYVVAEFALENNHEMPSDVLMHKYADKLYLLGSKSNLPGLWGNYSDPVINIFSIPSWERATYFFQENTKVDLNNYLTKLTHTNGELFALGAYKSRLGDKGMVGKFKENGQADLAFADAGYWINSEYKNIEKIFKVSAESYFIFTQRVSDSKFGILKINHTGSIVTSFADQGFFELPINFYFNYFLSHRLFTPYDENGLFYFAALTAGNNPSGKIFSIDIDSGLATNIDVKVPLGMKINSDGKWEVTDVSQENVAGTFKVRRMIYDGLSLDIQNEFTISQQGEFYWGRFYQGQYDLLFFELQDSFATKKSLRIVSYNETGVEINRSSPYEENQDGIIASLEFQDAKGSMVFNAITMVGGSFESEMHKFKNHNWSSVDLPKGSIMSSVAAKSDTEIYGIAYSVHNSSISERSLRRIIFK